MDTSVTFEFEGKNLRAGGVCITEKYVVAAGNTVYVHDLQCQQCSHKSQACSNHHAVFEVGLTWDTSFHRKSNLMLAAHADESGSMGLWNLEDGAHLRGFVGHTKASRVLFLDQDSYASALNDGSVLLWNRTEEAPTRTLRGHTGAVARMVRRDNFLITGSQDKTIRIWDLTTGEQVRVLDGGHSDYVSVLTFSPDGSLLRTASGKNGEVCIWDWRQGTLITKLSPEQAAAKIMTQFSDIGGYMVTCGVDGQIRTWTQQGSLVKTISAHEAPVRGLVLSGRFAVTVGSSDGRLKVWDWEKEEWLFDLLGPLRVVLLMESTAEKLAVASWERKDEASGEVIHKVQVWDLSELGQAGESKTG